MRRPRRRAGPAIRSRQLSATELLEAVLARIEAVNSQVNAIVTLAAGQATAVAADLDARAARGEFAGPLHGLRTTPGLVPADPLLTT